MWRYVTARGHGSTVNACNTPRRRHRVAHPWCGLRLFRLGEGRHLSLWCWPSRRFDSPFEGMTTMSPPGHVCPHPATLVHTRPLTAAGDDSDGRRVTRVTTIGHRWPPPVSGDVARPTLALVRLPPLLISLVTYKRDGISPEF